MKNKYFFIVIGIFFIFCFIVFLNGLKKSNIYEPKFEIGKKLPEFETEHFYSNKKISSKNLFEDYDFYIINIWASWCLPCREEHNYLVKLNKKNSVKLVGINYKDSKNNAKKFLEEFQNPYSEILLDKNGILSIEFGAFGVPETFIYNKEKILVKKIVGPINLKSFNEILKIIK